MQPAVLLGLLGATMVAAVSSMPVDNRNHNEEMVTRCIIEVLSNALLKSNAPPITPECRQALKKSGKEVKDEEKSENEKTRFKVRLLRDQADASEAHRPSSREDTGDPEEAGIQGLSVANTEGGGHSREGAGEPQGSLHPSESQVSKEAKTYHPEKSEGEDGEEEEGEKYPKREHGEGGSEEKHLEEPGETQNAFLDKRNQAAAKKKEEIMSRYNTHSARLPEEKTHSRERSSQESREETRNPEKHSESKSQSGSQEDSEESEEDASHEMDKRHWRPRHHHGRSRPDRSSQERNLPPEERGQPHAESEEPNVGMASLGDKRDRYPTHYRASEEEPEYGEVVRSYIGVPAPENLEGGRYGARGNEKYGAPRPPSDASQEEDRRTPPNAELDNMAYGYGEESEEERGPEWGYRHRARVGEPGAYASPDKEEKRFLGEGHFRVQENQMDKTRRHPQGEWKEQDRNDLNYGEENGEEGVQGNWQRQEDLQGTKENREEARLPGKQYAPYHTTEKRRRLGELLNPYYAPSQVKSSHFERKDDIGDNLLEGVDENGLTLNEKNFFPEYSYDWWERKPFEEDVNWGYEKRNLVPKLDLKRQYDRVAQLDQLLHFRKKSAEFPDFYDPEEPLSPHHEAEGGKDRAGPGVLTEEEEKELENLAAMDLELQKIAEKFSGNRRG
ncbi:secretogranin-1 [Myotis myotis]|uniref:Secretogranin-1 n=3 Tax=Myotis myotis TaxID=51298 RepID=A0A7J7VX95_MYOMY|nr:secretogranin-1 [Myotis myotis]KAF6329719.1 chromogranin B [Myotis myotis]